MTDAELDIVLCRIRHASTGVTRFSGLDHPVRVTDWLNHVELLLEEYEVPAKEWTRAVPSILEPQVITHYRTYKQTELAGKASWPDFRTFLCTNYDNASSKYDATCQLVALEYAGDIAQFNSSFSRLAEAVELQGSKEFTYHFYSLKLPDALREKVLSAQIDSLERAMRVAAHQAHVLEQAKLGSATAKQKPTDGNHAAESTEPLHHQAGTVSPSSVSDTCHSDDQVAESISNAPLIKKPQAAPLRCEEKPSPQPALKGNAFEAGIVGMPRFVHLEFLRSTLQKLVGKKGRVGRIHIEGTKGQRTSVVYRVGLEFEEGRPAEERLFSLPKESRCDGQLELVHWSSVKACNGCGILYAPLRGREYRCRCSPQAAATPSPPAEVALKAGDQTASR